MKADEIKDFYHEHNDAIIEKRFKSPYPLRKYAHDQQYASVLRFVEPGMCVLDAGCGEGVLSVMMAKKGARIVGCDLSAPNIERAKAFAAENDVQIEFLVGDGEALPFADSSFDLVVSSHVLEHLPDFDKGLREVMRVTKKRAVIAIPTILNPCSWVQVGGGWFYLKGPRSFAALPWGFLKMIGAYITLKEGVDETYAGQGVPHVFRFPRVMRRKLRIHGYSLIRQEASSIALPYFAFLLPLIRILDKGRALPIMRNWGYGTTFVVEKN